MRLTTEELVEIRDGAAWAVEGPWLTRRYAAGKTAPNLVMVTDTGRRKMCIECVPQGTADHIARLSPERVSSLITEVLELRAALKPFAAMRPVSIEATATGWAVNFSPGSPQPKLRDFENARKALETP